MTDNISSLLAKVSTITSVRTSSLGLSRIDKSASKETEMRHNSMSGIAKVNVSRLAGAEDRVKEIVSIQKEGREVLNAMTTAWGERRLLPNTLLEDFLKAWHPINARHAGKVNALIADAPQLIEQAQMNKGSFDVQVPTIDEIATGFKLEYTLEQVPDVTAFATTGLDKKVEELLKARFEANIQASYTDAQSDAVRRLAKPLENLVERMTAYDQRETDAAKGLEVGKTGFFRDSVISNVQEIADVFGQWNLTGDPVIKRLDDALAAFSNIAADDLRNHKDLRQDTAKRAAAILEEIRAGGYL